MLNQKYHFFPKLIALEAFVLSNFCETFGILSALYKSEKIKNIFDKIILLKKTDVPGTTPISFP